MLQIEDERGQLEDGEAPHKANSNVRWLVVNLHKPRGRAACKSQQPNEIDKQERASPSVNVCETS